MDFDKYHGGRAAFTFKKLLILFTLLFVTGGAIHIGMNTSEKGSVVSVNR